MQAGRFIRHYLLCQLPLAVRVLGMTLWLISMVLFVASSLMGGINYVSTILNMRTKGMDLWKMPLTIWAFFLTAVLGILSFPVLVAGVVLLIFDRSFGTSFYLSDIVMGTQILPNEGGSPILWQHLFWFLGHPEVYIVIMPAMGIVFRDHVCKFKETNFWLPCDGLFFDWYYHTCRLLFGVTICL